MSLQSSASGSKTSFVFALVDGLRKSRMRALAALLVVAAAASQGVTMRGAAPWPSVRSRLHGASAAAVAAAAASSVCHVSNVFGSHMVLQRDTPAMIFGFAAPGVSVTVSLNGAAQPPAAADAEGTWRVALPTQPATVTPSTIAFACSDGTTPAPLVDVLFGDVHICGGQSNAAFTLRSNAGVPNVTAEAEAANDYPLIRVFTVGQGTSSTTPLSELATVEQNWTVASNTSVGGAPWAVFSAVCWFTYRDVFNALGGTVPQGLVSNNWGVSAVDSRVTG